MERGDKIFVLQGVDVPLVLRRVDEGVIEGENRVERVNSDLSTGGQSLLIGANYVHGIMDGEEVKRKWELLREIHIKQTHKQYRRTAR
jgi:hypothetical protein